MISATDRKPQKFTVPRSVYRTFQQMHCEPQHVACKVCHACQYPLARAFAFNHDDAVIGITGKAVAAPFQLPIEFIQYHIGQYR